ncbi:adenylate kinase [Nocardioides mangrovicus]|uniref:Adenylate kinase n=2 Tax=Nocardioides mangrovicus TaxID=2478913 RepID=A0A3L8P212_9ACTN|nr:adenylate kinase [Nocardioides mangrovicus]
MSGAGKSTAARRLALAEGIPFHEMDALAIGPGWSTPTRFAEDVAALAAGDRWVVDSWAPAEVRGLLWSRADTIVWLDYPQWVVLPRLLRRSLHRSWTREPLFGGNVERWRDWLLPGHPFWHALTTFGRRRLAIADLAAAAPHARLVRVRRPAELPW